MRIAVFGCPIKLSVNRVAVLVFFFFLRLNVLVFEDFSVTTYKHFVCFYVKLLNELNMF